MKHRPQRLQSRRVGPHQQLLYRPPLGGLGVGGGRVLRQLRVGDDPGHGGPGRVRPLRGRLRQLDPGQVHAGHGAWVAVTDTARCPLHELLALPRQQLRQELLLCRTQPRQLTAVLQVQNCLQDSATG